MATTRPGYNMKLLDELQPGEDTGALLEAERHRCTFDLEALTAIIRPPPQVEAQRKLDELLGGNPIFDTSMDVFMTRTEYFRKGVERALETARILQEKVGQGGLVADKGKLALAAGQGTKSAVSGLHYGVFVPTIMAQGTQEQVAEWVPKALKLGIQGSYAQTELGHGTNVRGIETTASYDPEAKEFVINSPTLTSLKWWPGNLGVSSTHAVVYARLILGGKDLGYHAFVVQLRDEKHRPLPGVVVGDIGPKVGMNYADNGFLGFRNVRVPKKAMLAKFQHINDAGEYVKPPRALSKIGYLSMTRTRVAIVRLAYQSLSRGVTIGIRWNAVRRQGFKQGLVRAGDEPSSGEFQILDYPMQQLRLLENLAAAYALYYVSAQLTKSLSDFEKMMKQDPTLGSTELPELHATSAGLKAFTTQIVLSGLEECRQCCGGQGYAMSSGLGPLIKDYMPNVTFEGDTIPMALQTARYLIRSHGEGRAGKPLAPAVQYMFAEDNTQLMGGSFRDPRVLIALFEASARRSIAQAAKQLESHRSQGKSGEGAWTASHVALVRAARGHCMLTIVRCFAEGVAGVGDGQVRAALLRLLAVFALGSVRRGEPATWAGLLTHEQWASFDANLHGLFKEIRPDAVALVDGFGFTDQQLYDSCIGKSDGKVYEALVDSARKSELNDPSFQDKFFHDFLKPSLDLDYLKEGGDKAKLSTSAKL